MSKSKMITIGLMAIFILFIAISFHIGYPEGEHTGKAFVDILIEMLKILPCAFIIIGLFEVWVKKETVIKHLGDDAGIRGYLWVLALASVSVGGLYVGLPVAQTLRKKGANLSVIFSYLGFVGVIRIPMTVFEISFLGIHFTAIRLLVTLPLFLVSGIMLGYFLKKDGYTFPSRN